MSFLIDKELMQKAVDVFGYASQQNKLLEEASEATTALIQHKNKQTIETAKCLVDEIADLLIMTNQIEFIFDTIKEEIQARIDFKQDRLRKKITYK